MLQFFQKTQTAWWRQTGVYCITKAITLCAFMQITLMDNPFLLYYKPTIRRKLCTNLDQVAQKKNLRSQTTMTYIIPVSISSIDLIHLSVTEYLLEQSHYIDSLYLPSWYVKNFFFYYYCILINSLLNQAVSNNI